AVASTVAATHSRLLLSQGHAAAAALTGGFQQAFWVTGITALAAGPVTFLLIRRTGSARAAAASPQREAPPPAPADWPLRPGHLLVHSVRSQTRRLPDEQEQDGRFAAAGPGVGDGGGVVRRRAADTVRPGIRARADRGGGRRDPGRASGLRAGGGRAARRGRRVADDAARFPGRLPRLGAGGPDARRRPAPAAVRGAGRAGRLGQAPRLPVLDRRARGPGPGAVAAPPRAGHRGGHL